MKTPCLYFGDDADLRELVLKIARINGGHRAKEIYRSQAFGAWLLDSMPLDELYHDHTVTDARTITVPQIREWIAKHEKPVEEPILVNGEPVDFRHDAVRFTVTRGGSVFIPYPTILAIAARLPKEDA